VTINNINKENKQMARVSRLTGDITLEAHNMLRSYCKKHERSKGFLLEKMIRKFCSDEVIVATPSTAANIATVEKKPVKRFVPPTVEQVFEYCNERCNSVDAQNFVDHYTANGWMRGKGKVKDWKACVRTWEKNNQTKVKNDENLGGNW
tara:strand:- start:15308 stop:15754 length:447 start_codon:yes stop_codon:yes gene_type:complete